MRGRKMQNDNPDTLPAVLAEAARLHGERLAIVDGETRLSFAALEQAVLTAAAAYARAGLHMGSRVAIWEEVMARSPLVVMVRVALA